MLSTPEPGVAVDARTPATEAASSWALLRFVSLKLYLKEETEGQEKC